KPTTPNGRAHKNSSASTRNADPSHHSPATKYPKPSHQPQVAARATFFNPGAASSTDRSMSQTPTVRVMNKIGHSPNGGMASAPNAPVDKASNQRMIGRAFDKADIHDPGPREAVT